MFEITTTSLDALVQGIRQRTGYDFSRYSKASLKRRLLSALETFGLPDLNALRNRLSTEDGFCEALVEEITVNVTAMFRDALFFRSMREKVLPVLATYPYLKIWFAGCSSGEEMYSFAILFEEAGILDRCTMYGTDINQDMLERAGDGIYSVTAIDEYTENYRRAGGLGAFSDCYTVKSGRVKMSRRYRERMVFGLHNLVTDSSFNEFNLVVCRNVLIYFEKELQDHVFELFCESLPVFGFLALGNKESLKFSTSESRFARIDKDEKIYRRIS